MTRQYIPILSIASLVFIIFTGCFKEKSAATFPSVGIVTSSKLICRKEPHSKSASIRSFNFSNPLVLISKSKSKDTINGIEDYWYQEKSSSGWVFGGYLIITAYNESSFYKLKADRIWCNVVCGGFSCFYEFEPYIIGDYFIAYIYLNDYPQENEPYAGILIGNYSKKDNKLIFDNIIALGGYTEKGDWIKDYSTAQLKSYAGMKHIFKKAQDSAGEYFIPDDTKPAASRSALREKCKTNKTEEIMYQTYNLKKISIDDYKTVLNIKIK